MVENEKLIKLAQANDWGAMMDALLETMGYVLIHHPTNTIGGMETPCRYQDHCIGRDKPKFTGPIKRSTRGLFFRHYPFDNEEEQTVGYWGIYDNRESWQPLNSHWVLITAHLRPTGEVVEGTTNEQFMAVTAVRSQVVTGSELLAALAATVNDVLFDISAKIQGGRKSREVASKVLAECEGQVRFAEDLAKALGGDKAM